MHVAMIKVALKGNWKFSILKLSKKLSLSATNIGENNFGTTSSCFKAKNESDAIKVAVWYVNDVVHIKIFQTHCILQSTFFRERLIIEDHHEMLPKGTIHPKNL